MGTVSDSSSEEKVVQRMCSLSSGCSFISGSTGTSGSTFGGGYIPCIYSHVIESYDK